MCKKIKKTTTNVNRGVSWFSGNKSAQIQRRAAKQAKQKKTISSNERTNSQKQAVVIIGAVVDLCSIVGVR